MFPADSGAYQAWIAGISPSGAFAMPAKTGRLRDSDISFAAAYHTGSNIARGHFPLARA
jgi:hypothetical protein